MYLELVKRYCLENEPAEDYEVLEFLKIKIYYFDYGPKKNLELYLDSKGKKTKINSKIQRKA